MRFRKTFYTVPAALLTFAATVSAIPVQAAPKPKLIVNIVVSQMPYDYLRQMSSNFSGGGFRRFMEQGLSFGQASYGFAKSVSPATLATLTTGVCPDMHGIVGTEWIDYTTNKSVSLIADPKASGLGGDADAGRYSPVNLIVPTLGDKLRRENPGSKVVTIALDPVSAVVMGGRGGDVYWMDANRGEWMSSTAYMSSLPEWVDNYNRTHAAREMLDYRWTPLLSPERYTFTKSTVIDLGHGTGRAGQNAQASAKTSAAASEKSIARDCAALLRTPAGNTLVAEMAKQAVTYEKLGQDSDPDILNICFDTPRYVGEMYGSRSMEVEDMFCRLDGDIASLVSFIEAQVPLRDVLFVLTSDHGANPEGGSEERFNGDMFRMLVNGLLSAQYGPYDWVSGFYDGELYLDHDYILSHDYDLAQLQNKLASFAVQFGGVAHALSASTLSGSYFGSGYARMMQRSFYPKRSGDILLNLMPGWSIETPDVLSSAGTMYDYDTHVPLMLLGSAITPGQVRAQVDMCSVVPTLAHILDISPPMAPETPLVNEIIDCYEQ